MFVSGSGAKDAHKEPLGVSDVVLAPGPDASRGTEPDGDGAGAVPVEEVSRDQDRDGVVAFEASLAPFMRAEMAQLPPAIDLPGSALDKNQTEEGSDPGVGECSGGIVGPSPASYFRSDGPQVIRCFQVASRLPRGDGGDCDCLSSRLFGVPRVPHSLSPPQLYPHTSKCRLSRRTLGGLQRCCLAVCSNLKCGDGSL